MFDTKNKSIQDWPTDAVVMATYSYLDQMEGYSQFVDEHPFLSLFITPPTPPLIMKYYEAFKKYNSSCGE